MISIKIAEVKRDVKDLADSWIHEQIRQRQAEGMQVCVRVFVKTGNVDLMLSSAGCSKVSGEGRQATEQENRIMLLWSKFDLDSSPVHSGRLVAFLSQVKDLV